MASAHPASNPAKAMPAPNLSKSHHAFPELRSVMAEIEPELPTHLGHQGYEVSAIIPQTASWRYVRHPQRKVVVRRETSVGVALRRRRADDCVYVAPTIVQDRLGARGWGPLRFDSGPHPTRRLDCAELNEAFVSR
ncbi:MAG: hypothetical protein AAFV29_06410 [Myxococcota bacterium]